VHLRLRRAKADPEREIARWRARLDVLATGREKELVATSFDVRFAARMLARAVGAGGLGTGAATLVLDEAGDWFAIGGGERIDVGRRGSIKRILRLLALRHGAAPGVSVSRDALLSAGWPEERLHPDAASKRLRVAINTLRSLGLRDVLLTRDDGYLLDSRLLIESRGAKRG
jgi:hypothetical protein